MSPEESWAAPAGSNDQAPQPRRKRRWPRRVGIGLLVTVVVVVLLGATAYEFGVMEPPTAQQKAVYAEMVREGKVPPVRFEQGLRIPVPGCTCHSNDAYLAVEHSSIPIRQCSSCHGG